MTDVERTRPKHENPWLVTVGGGIAVALIVAAITEWPFWKIAAFVVGPLLLLMLGGLGVWGIVRARRAARDQREEFMRLWQRVDHLEARLADYALKEVVGEAIRRGWRIAHDSGGFTLTSPDEDVVLVDYWELNAHRVATDLHNASPHHFPEEWLPPLVSNTMLALEMGAEARAGIKSLDARVDRLENPTRGKALMDALARQRASLETSGRTSS